MTELIAAIKTVRRLRDNPLNVKHYATHAEWDEKKDEGWQEYKRAREVIAGHRKIEAVFKKVGAI